MHLRVGGGTFWGRLGRLTMAKPKEDEYTEQQIARRRDEAIKRALRTPPTHLKDIPKKRPPKQGAPPSKRDGA
jgi:hypothetical protein